MNFKDFPELNDILYTEEVLVHQRYNYRMYPTKEQETYLKKNFGCTRKLHNVFVGELVDYLKFKKFIKGTIPDDFKFSSVKQIKDKFSYMDEVDSLALMNVRKNLLQSIKKYNEEFALKGNNYTKRSLKLKETTGKEPSFRDLKGFPKFKAKHYCEESFTTNNQPASNSVRLEQIPDYENKRFIGLRIPKLKDVLKIRYHRPLPENYRLKSVTVERTKSGEYYVSISVDYTMNITKIKNDEKSFSILKDFLFNHLDLVLGLDYAQQGGCVPSCEEKDFLDSILSTFDKKYRKQEKKLQALQRRLSKKKKPDYKNKDENGKYYEGSNAYQKLRSAINRIHRKIRNMREDALNKLSRIVANKFLMVSVEDIDLRGMSQSLRLAKNLLDNGFGEFREMLSYKMEREGKLFVKIDKWFPSSQICHDCGFQNSITKDLSVEKYVCPNCGESILRNFNAALNIRDEGIRSLKPISVKKKKLTLTEKLQLGRDTKNKRKKLDVA